MKITGAHLTKSSNEVDVLKFIASNEVPSVSREYLQILLNHFVHQGPNGIHSCVVSKPAWFTVAQGLFCMQKRRSLPVEVARAITGQLITGLAALHAIGIVHGDLHPGNIILAHPDRTFKSQTIEEIYKSYYRPTKIPLHLYQAATLEKPPIPDNAPLYIVASLYATDGFDALELSDAEVIIGDFAPESLFGKRLNLNMDRPSDIWSLGCLICRLFGVRPILDTAHHDPEENFVRAVRMIGKPPQQWWDLSEMKDGFNHNAGNDNEAHDDLNEYGPIDETKASLRRRVMVWLKEDRGSDMTDEELEDMLALLEPMFHWLPNERTTASDLLSSPWMKKWGLPAMESMKRERKAKKKEGTMISSSTQSHQAYVNGETGTCICED
ncbi:Dual specificity protein kinase CLK4 [Colletotrichum aenigma]|uniref:Dual specificity protein kinase CLK4 n=1 Tax=Colletotrichum aenigma TaxID=1215731 RepID=UPI001872771A|nr:Dual specificity protein kinase CLK4 [Colletotrichum aenigma]KAF5517985.1 Dual specificity protein kinase CLK4 [Colletotrichum aenigma]